MNLENLLESSLINEMGGNVFDFTSRIPKENVQPTIREYKKQVLDKLGIERFQSLGSTGKKSSSGDIDLGVSTTMDVKEIGQKLNDIGIPNRPAGTQVWTAFPQYGPDGKELDSTVQIDIMLGDLDWMTHAYYSPGEGESKYKGAHRNLILGLALRYAKEEDAPEGGKIGLAYSAQGGVNKKRRFKKVMTRGKNKGQEKEDSEFIERNFIKNWDGLLKYLSDNTKETWTIEDVDQPFEGLLEKVRRSFDAETFEKIKAGVIEGCKKKGIDNPNELEEEIQMGFFNMLAEEVLNEKLSVREDFYLKKKNGEDLLKVYRFLKDQMINEFGQLQSLKTHEHLRTNFPNDWDINDLENFIKSLKSDSLDLENIEFDFRDLKVDIISPSNSDPDSPRPNEVFSGTYPTYKIYNEDFYFYVTNTNKDGVLPDGDARPDGLGLGDKTFESFESLLNAAEDGVRKIGDKYKEAREFMLHLLENVPNSSNSKPYKLYFDKHEAEKASKHLATIYKYFGEVISALVYQKNIGGSVYIPKSGKPVVDFITDDIEYSVKYGKGAAGTITEIIRKYGSPSEIVRVLEEEDIDFDGLEKFKTVIETIADNSNNNSTINLKIAESFYKDIYKKFESFMGRKISSKDFNKSNIKDIINKRFQEIKDQGLDLEEEVKEYHKSLGGFKPKKSIDELLKLNKAYGLITYPLATKVVKRINQDEDLIEDWKKTLNKLYKTYQVRTNVSGGVMNFEEKAFNTIKKEDVKFSAGGSTDEPENQKLRASYK